MNKAYFANNTFFNSLLNPSIPFFIMFQSHSNTYQFFQADDESINSRLKKFGKTVRKTMKSLDRMLETIETIDKVRL